MLCRCGQSSIKGEKFIIPRLKALGFGVTFEPQGAFNILGNAKNFIQDSQAFAYDILEKAQVAVTPGIDFGNNAEGYLRFSYANSLENIHEGMNWLEDYLKNR
jgi:aspartate/methionine/tyrosine aminotransferase